MTDWRFEDALREEQEQAGRCRGCGKKLEGEEKDMEVCFGCYLDEHSED